jgi:methionyl aminopeptidase
MINIRTEEEIDKMRAACRIAADAMGVARDMIKPDITTLEISEAVKEYIEDKKAKASFLGYNGFPGAICASVNQEIIHGIPGKRTLKNGDIVKIDVGVYLNGYHSDLARTYPVGEISEEAVKLIDSTRESFFKGIEKAVPDNKIGDIGHAIQSFVESRGYNVVRALVGHGIGRNLHEDPQVPNYGRPGDGPRLRSGMVLAIEPMVNAGTWKVKTLDDDWTVITQDGKLSAHYENTCVIREGAPEILTLLKGE